MNGPTIPSRAGRRAPVALPDPFDGYPYLVARIGHSALRHLAVLPADWPRGRLLDLARRQALANRLETSLCIGPAEVVFFAPDGDAEHAVIIPTGIPVVERLALAEPVPQTDEPESSGPAAARNAPSTPPPLAKALFAAFTMASAGTRVRSPGRSASTDRPNVRLSAGGSITVGLWSGSGGVSTGPGSGPRRE